MDDKETLRWIVLRKCRLSLNTTVTKFRSERMTMTLSTCNVCKWYETLIKGKRWTTMNVFKYTKQINNTGLRVMSPSLHQSCIIIILFTSYKSHIVSIVFPCWDEQGKLLGHPHGSTLHNLLGLGHFWQCNSIKELRSSDVKTI